MPPDLLPLRRAALHLGLGLSALTGVPSNGHGQASMVSALAGVSSVPTGGGGRAVVTEVGGGSSAARVGGSAPAAGGAAHAVTSLTTGEVAAMVQAARGRAAVVILYGLNCPRTRAMFPGFTALAARHAGRNVSWLAFASQRRARDVPPFLAQFGAPFEAYYIKPWQPGEMSQDMATVGLRLGQRWNMPHVAVLNASGQVVGEWDAATDLMAIDVALSSLP